MKSFPTQSLICNPLHKCVAISYDSATFHDLKFYLYQLHGVVLDRIEPNELATKYDTDSQYINLVIRDTEERELVSSFLNNRSADRFSFIHPTATVDGAKIGRGVFIYPQVVMYPQAVIEDDILMHSYVGIAHKSKVKTGTVISGYCTVLGGSVVNEFCNLGSGTIVYENISICARVQTGVKTVIRKSINTPGTYFTKYNTMKLRKINISRVAHVTSMNQGRPATNGEQ